MQIRSRRREGGAWRRRERTKVERRQEGSLLPDKRWRPDLVRTGQHLWSFQLSAEAWAHLNIISRQKKHFVFVPIILVSQWRPSREKLLSNHNTETWITTAISRRMVFDILKVVKAEKYGCGALILSNRHFWWIGCKTLKVKFNHLILFYL